MEKHNGVPSTTVVGVLFLLFSITLPTKGVQGTIGVNYGTVANNLPPPSEVANFLLQTTIINRVRLFDSNPTILQAFAHTGIQITITVPNEQIPNLTKLLSAQQWVKTNVLPYFPATNIVRILVGNEVLSTANKLLIASLVPAMQNLHTALVGMSLDRRIKVSTPHSLGILASSSPPSTGQFRKGYDTVVLKPLLSFLKATNAPFMVNPYPFFGSSSDTLDYALFRVKSGVVDTNTQLVYTNMLDAQLDAVFSAMKILGFSDVEIVIAETGWPSMGDSGQVGVDAESAAQYNGNLVRHVTSGAGTPLMPNRTFETYVFALFNENLKPGPLCERNFGLFRPDMTAVYDIGILRPTKQFDTGVYLGEKSSSSSKGIGYKSEGMIEKGSASVPSIPSPNTSPSTSPSPSPILSPSPSPSPIFSPSPSQHPNPSPVVMPISPIAPKGNQWCLPKSGADPYALQRNIDYVCGLGVNCQPIQDGGPCFLPNTVRAHAAYAMNAYYHAMGKDAYACDFRHTGAVTTIDPSYGGCKY